MKKSFRLMILNFWQLKQIRSFICTVILFLIFSQAVFANPVSYNFENDNVGSLPSGWFAAGNEYNKVSNIIAHDGNQSVNFTSYNGNLGFNLNDLTPVGSLDFYAYFNSQEINNSWSVRLKDDVNGNGNGGIVALLLNNTNWLGSHNYGATSFNSGVTAVIDSWNHIRIEWDFRGTTDHIRWIWNDTVISESNTNSDLGGVRSIVFGQGGISPSGANLYLDDVTVDDRIFSYEANFDTDTEGWTLPSDWSHSSTQGNPAAGSLEKQWPQNNTPVTFFSPAVLEGGGKRTIEASFYVSDPFEREAVMEGRFTVKFTDATEVIRIIPQPNLYLGSGWRSSKIIFHEAKDIQQIYNMQIVGNTGSYFSGLYSCLFLDSYRIKIVDWPLLEIAAPEAFSPNGDGIYDTQVINVYPTDSMTITLEILDLSQTVVATLAQNQQISQLTTYCWDGMNGSQPFSNGTYTARLTIGEEVITRSFVLNNIQVWPNKPQLNVSFDFENDNVGSLPSGWFAAGNEYNKVSNIIAHDGNQSVNFTSYNGNLGFNLNDLTPVGSLDFYAYFNSQEINNSWSVRLKDDVNGNGNGGIVALLLNNTNWLGSHNYGATSFNSGATAVTDSWNHIRIEWDFRGTTDHIRWIWNDTVISESNTNSDLDGVRSIVFAQGGFSPSGANLYLDEVTVKNNTPRFPFDFENDNVGSLPSGWFAAGNEYNKVSNIIAHDGNQSVNFTSYNGNLGFNLNDLTPVGSLDFYAYFNSQEINNSWSVRLKDDVNGNGNGGIVALLLNNTNWLGSHNYGATSFNSGATAVTDSWNHIRIEWDFRGTTDHIRWIWNDTVISESNTNSDLDGVRSIVFAQGGFSPSGANLYLDEVTVKDDIPFFPIGVYFGPGGTFADSTAAATFWNQHFAALAAGGFNTVHGSNIYNMSIGDLRSLFLQCASNNNLKAILQSPIAGTVFKGWDGANNCIPANEEDLYNILCQERNTFSGYNSFLGSDIHEEIPVKLVDNWVICSRIQTGVDPAHPFFLFNVPIPKYFIKF